MFMVCGEVLLDVFAAGPSPTGIALDGRIGGSPFNVAVGLARLGRRVGFLGGISRGFVGERLTQALLEEGIDTRAVARLDAPATLSLVGLDARGVPSYAFYGHGAADRNLAPEHLAAVPAECRAFQFGSYAMVVEPTGSSQRLLVERECQRSLISYDPNVRLNVQPQRDIWRATLDWMSQRAHLLKLSDEDLGLLYPGQSPDAMARLWLARGVALVVVTRGSDGATAFTARDTLDVKAPTVAVVDTVGAGDSFQAALLTALAERGLATPAALRNLQRQQLAAVCDFAAQAAAITCTRRGADLPRRHELP